jgi:hypothetical protein
MYLVKLLRNRHKDRCKKCNNYKCNAMRFQRRFKNWTSGDHDIDKFIQDIQLSNHYLHEISNVLEWIPYDRFYDIKYITKIGIYRANWIDRRTAKWDNKNHNWKRYNQNMFVTLKSLNNSSNITLEFMNKV